MAARSFVSSILDLAEEDGDLGEKVNQLIKLRNAGFDIPPGFVIKSVAFAEFLKKNNLNKKIKHLLNTVDLELPKSVRDTANHITKHIEESEIPEYITKEIVKEYKKISGILHHGKVSIHLSHPDEVLTIQFVAGDSSVLHTVKSFWSKLFTKQSNPTIVVQKTITGKTGKIRSSTKLIRTPHNLTNKERLSLESLVEKFKKEFYLPHEIDFVIKGNKTYILKITPESHVEESSYFPETHYKILKNSHHLI